MPVNNIDADPRNADWLHGRGKAMELITAEIRKALPGLRSTDDQGLDAPIIVKFFTPTSNWTWYVTEFDGDDTLFGLVSGFETELGYFSLSELESVRGPYGIGVERDLYFGRGHTLREFMPE